MRRPAVARQALRIGPLIEATGAHAAGVEGVPEVTATTHPLVFSLGDPAAEWAANLAASSAGTPGFGLGKEVGPILNCGPIFNHPYAAIRVHPLLPPMGNDTSEVNRTATLQD